jgi:hypothetical protein
MRRQLTDFTTRTVARLFRIFPAKVAGKFEKILPLNKCCGKQHFQTPLMAKDNS